MERILILAMLLAVCYLLLRYDDLIPRGGGLGVMVLLTVSFAVRWWLWDRVPSAAEDTVRDALTWFRGAGGFWGLRSCAEPFSPAMQAVLALCSLRFRGSLDTFKYLSLLSDIFTAWFLQRCVRQVQGAPGPRRRVFVLFLLLPSVVLQGCSSMGEGFRFLWILAAAGAAAGGKGVLAGVFLGLGCAFHPMMLCLLPVFWCFPVIRQNTLRTLGPAVGVYFLAALPSMILGRGPALTLPFWPPADLLKDRLPFGGAPGLYALPQFAPPVYAGIAAYSIIALLLIFRLGGRDAVHDRRRQLGALCCAAAGLGALLPWTGISILYGAEALVLALAVLEPGMTTAALCLILSSGYVQLREYFPALLPWPAWYAAAAALLGTVILFGYGMFKKS